MAALQRASRMSAAVDNSCVQDDYTLYHHTMVVTEDGDWTVVQQGMGDASARRYHWQSADLDGFVTEPQAAIASMDSRQTVLNLPGDGSTETRDVAVDLVNDDPRHLERYLRPGQASLDAFTGGEELRMPRHHRLQEADLTERSIRQLEAAYERQPEGFDELVDVDGVGRKSLRALALIAELVHGTENDWDDPAKYAYAHGGKDGTPYPVHRDRYDESIEHVQRALRQADVTDEQREAAQQRLQALG